MIGFCSEAELRSLITAIATEVAAELVTSAPADNGRLAYPEPEAASLLGVKGHVLRDARLRREIIATKVGGRICYEASELRRYLAANRIT